MEAKLENFIKDFVFHRVSEVVDLHLKTGVISIQHVSKKGSILLAKLWANILQHPPNYPPDEYPYKQQKNPKTGDDQLFLKAGGVIFTINMKNGALHMQGQYVLEWFCHNFGQLLENFDRRFADGWHYEPSLIEVIKVTRDREALGDYLTGE